MIGICAIYYLGCVQKTASGIFVSATNEGKRTIARQDAVVARLAKEDHDCRLAQQLLTEFETALASHISDPATALLAELAALFVSQKSERASVEGVRPKRIGAANQGNLKSNRAVS